jgi:KRAB domain-containing zinc finger protein
MKDLPDFKIIRRREKQSSKMPRLCEICGKSIGSESALRSHTASFHGGERGYSCHVCQKQIYCKNRYEDHVSMHKGVKNHHCTVCDGEFTTKSGLKMHVQRMHMIR